MEDNSVVYRVVIPSPLEYIDITGKRINKETGLPKTDRYYLTANIFYGGIHFTIQKIIVDNCKWFLSQYIKPCPILNDPPYSIVLQYCSPKTNFDLDNKCYFWQKMISDMLAPPAPKKKSKIKIDHPDRKLQSDSVKFIDCLGWEYYKTEETYLVLLILKH